jgi:iron complex transport system ATP-binding protein
VTLRATAVAVRYGERAALQPTSFELEPGQFVALVGPNGAGKSTLLKALAGLVPHAGDVDWQGQPLAALGADARARTVAYLPQSPTVHWPLPTRELVALGRLPHRAYAASGKTDDEAAVDWALASTATAAFAERSVDRLSVGERARVLLARALAVRAPVLLVDEPIAVLDPYHQLQVMEVLRAYASAGSAAANRPLVVAVLHDLALAARFCDRVLLLDGGRLAADGTPEETLTADALRRHYRVEPLIIRHEGAPLIVPWSRIDT